jgi:hypothetical protein
VITEKGGFGHRRASGSNVSAPNQVDPIKFRCGTPQGRLALTRLVSMGPHNPAMTPDLTNGGKAILAELLRQIIARDRFPLSPRVWSFQAILDKLAPPAPRREPLRAPKPPGERSMALTKSRRR